MRCTTDFAMPISSAVSRTDIPGRQQGGDPQPRGDLHVLHAPGGLALAGIELHFERLGVPAVEAAALLDMDLEARALGRRVVARTAQAKRGVEHVLAATGDWCRAARRACRRDARLAPRCCAGAAAAAIPGSATKFASRELFAKRWLVEMHRKNIPQDDGTPTF
jgi:hypothetical protein